MPPPRRADTPKRTLVFGPKPEAIAPETGPRPGSLIGTSNPPVNSKPCTTSFTFPDVNGVKKFDAVEKSTRELEICWGRLVIRGLSQSHRGACNGDLPL